MERRVVNGNNPRERKQGIKDWNKAADKSSNQPDRSRG
jgi:hypothetical protein